MADRLGGFAMGESAGRLNSMLGCQGFIAFDSLDGVEAKDGK